MEAKEILDHIFDLDKYQMADQPYHNSEEAVLEAMNEFAKLKCEELLSLAAEKAKIRELNYEDEQEWVCYNEVDKESILNCIDLEEFIKS